MRKTTNLRKRIFTYSLLLAFFVSLIVMLVQAGQWLVRLDELKPADAILILTGTKGDRALHAADLFNKGYAPLILIVHDHEPGKEYLAQQDIYLPNAAEITQSLLLQMNLPDSSILLLPGAAQSTKDEADAVAAWLQTVPNIQSLLIVSSEAHTRRSLIIFNNRFRKQGLAVTPISAPSPYTGFQARGWWQHRESAKDVFQEYVKLTYFLLADSWR